MESEVLDESFNENGVSRWLAFLDLFGSVERVEKDIADLFGEVHIMTSFMKRFRELGQALLVLGGFEQAHGTEMLAIPPRSPARTATTPFAGLLVPGDNIETVAGFRPDLESLLPLIIVGKIPGTRRLSDDEFFAHAVNSNTPMFSGSTGFLPDPFPVFEHAAGSLHEVVPGAVEISAQGAAKSKGDPGNTDDRHIDDNEKSY